MFQFNLTYRRHKKNKFQMKEGYYKGNYIPINPAFWELSHVKWQVQWIKLI